MKIPPLLALLLATIASLSIGCTQSVERTIIRGQLPQIIQEESGEFFFVSATLVDGERVIFDEEGGQWVEDATTVTAENYGAVVGVDTAGVERRIPVGEIVEARLDENEPSVAGTVVLATTAATIGFYLLLTAALGGIGHL